MGPHLTSDRWKQDVKLTDMQQKVVRLLSLGCSVIEAACILRIRPSTADNHKTRAMRALGIRKITLLTRYAIATSISPIDDKLTRQEQNALTHHRQAS
jgi:DNA-binding CsgD family transcriptional regulator